jgi:hypothetical protein
MDGLEYRWMEPGDGPALERRWKEETEWVVSLLRYGRAGDRNWASVRDSCTKKK